MHLSNDRGRLTVRESLDLEQRLANRDGLRPDCRCGVCSHFNHHSLTVTVNSKRDVHDHDPVSDFDEGKHVEQTVSEEAEVMNPKSCEWCSASIQDKNVAPPRRGRSLGNLRRLGRQPRRVNDERRRCSFLGWILILRQFCGELWIFHDPGLMTELPVTSVYCDAFSPIRLPRRDSLSHSYGHDTIRSMTLADQLLNASISTVPDEVSPEQYMDQLKEASSRSLSSIRQAAALDGLSKFHRSILSRTTERQHFVTGQYPLTVTVQENPTRKWLSQAKTEILINGTTPSRSLASLDRFHWLDDDDQRSLLLESYAMVSLELIAEIRTERPGYLLIATEQHEPNASHQHKTIARAAQHRDYLWVTGFSLAGGQGLLRSVECETGVMTSVSPRTAQNCQWPNEVQGVPNYLILPRLNATNETTQERRRRLRTSPVVSATRKPLQDALLVCDGFLVPGKDRGGLYVVKHPGNPKLEEAICLTSNGSTSSGTRGVKLNYFGYQNKQATDVFDLESVADYTSTSTSTAMASNDRWFYHRAVWLDLTGDGRQSILTARCKVSTALDRDADVGIMSGITKNGELVWLECPEPPYFDPDTGTPLESDRVTIFDPFSSRHLPWKTHVLANGPDVMFAVADLDPADDTIEVIASEFFNKRVTLQSIKRGKKPRLSFTRTIDSGCGAAFGMVLADLESCNHHSAGTGPGRRVVDSGSTIKSLNDGDSFSHLLVTSHERSYAESDKPGALGERDSIGESKGATTTEDQKPLEGGSLFAYRVPNGKGAWRTTSWTRTTVATGFKVKGKLGNMVNPGAPGFVYTFHATKQDPQYTNRPLIAVAGDCSESAYVFRPETSDSCDVSPSDSIDPSTRYKAMIEIECGATVGSIAIGYEDCTAAEQESGYAKLYIPCYEKDKILVFALGSGEDDIDGW